MSKNYHNVELFKIPNLSLPKHRRDMSSIMTDAHGLVPGGHKSTNTDRPINEMTFEEEETQYEPNPTEILIDAIKHAKSRHKK